jgi:hypothetical protein
MHSLARAHTHACARAHTHARTRMHGCTRTRSLARTHATTHAVVGAHSVFGPRVPRPCDGSRPGAQDVRRVAAALPLYYRYIAVTLLLHCCYIAVRLPAEPPQCCVHWPSLGCRCVVRGEDTKRGSVEKFIVRKARTDRPDRPTDRAAHNTTYRATLRQHPLRRESAAAHGPRASACTQRAKGKGPAPPRSSRIAPFRIRRSLLRRSWRRVRTGRRRIRSGTGPVTVRCGGVRSARKPGSSLPADAAVGDSWCIPVGGARVTRARV